MSVRNATGSGLNMQSRRNAGSGLLSLAPTCWISATSVMGVNDNVELTGTIVDLSGNANHGTISGAGGPLYRTSQTPNGSPCFQTQAGKRIELPAFNLFGGTSQGHLFILFRTINGGVSNTNGPWALPGEENTPWTNNGNTCYTSVWGSGYFGYDSVIAMNNQMWHILEMHHTPTNMVITVDGIVRYDAAHTYVVPNQAWIACQDNNFRVAAFVSFKGRYLGSEEAGYVRGELSRTFGT